MNVYGGLKWMLWLMCNCDFLGKGEKGLSEGNGNSTGNKRDLAVNSECKNDMFTIEF